MSYTAWTSVDVALPPDRKLLLVLQEGNPSHKIISAFFVAPHFFEDIGAQLYKVTYWMFAQTPPENMQ